MSEIDTAAAATASAIVFAATATSVNILAETAAVAVVAAAAVVGIASTTAKEQTSIALSALSGALSITSIFMAISHLKTDLENSIPLTPETIGILEATPKKRQELEALIKPIIGEFNQKASAEMLEKAQKMLEKNPNAVNEILKSKAPEPAP